MTFALASKSTFLSGTKVSKAQPRSVAKRTQSRLAVPTQAKYGDESTFFDLDDLENTAGSWDLYGQTDERRYPGIQAEFFERAAAPLTRRESVYAFVTLAGFAGIAVWGAKGASAVKLPITVGPKKGGEKGPRGRL